MRNAEYEDRRRNTEVRIQETEGVGFYFSPNLLS
jgi:hypothetical protein